MNSRLWILLAALLLTLGGCASDEDGNNEGADTGATSSGGTDSSSGADTTPNVDLSGGDDTSTSTCTYPSGHDGFINLGKIMPEMTWDSAFMAADGTPISFGLEAFFCDPAYDKYNVAMFFITAEWCPACHEMLAGFGSDGTFAMLEAAGALPILVEVQDNDYAPPSSAYALESISQHADNFAGIIVGDGDTAPAISPTALARTPLIGSYPGGFVVRRSDMLVISKTTEGDTYIDLMGIAQDPDAFWDGTPPNTEPTCGPADEEEWEPANNTAAGAPVLELNRITEGGICDDQPDFYRVDYGGQWLLDLKYDSADGDLDFYLWDETTNDYFFTAGGQRLGSAEPGPNGVFQFQGPATVYLFGYNGSTAPYRLTLVPLD